MPDFTQSPDYIKRVDDVLTRGVVDVIDRDHLRERMLSGDILRVKLGIDPTGPDIHIGRASTLKKLRQFQDLGHKAVLIIGNFTAQIGDSSDKPEGRKGLSEDAIRVNLNNYLDQIGKVVDLSKAEIHYNNDWLGKLTTSDWIKLAKNFTLQQMMERDNFAQRLAAGQPVGLHETMYSIAQGYDSYAVKSDLELGGTDQLFNLEAGRKIQSFFGQRPQDIMSLQLLIGPDGRKMSTSWGNVIKVIDLPREKYGKLMRIKDQLIPVYAEMLTDMPLEEIKKIESELEAGKVNPMELKKMVAKMIVEYFDGVGAAELAAKHFEKTVQRKDVPDEDQVPVAQFEGEAIPLNDILKLVKQVNITRSKSDASRILRQGGIKLIDNYGKEMPLDTDAETFKIPKKGLLIKVGKYKFIRIISSDLK